MDSEVFSTPFLYLIIYEEEGLWTEELENLPSKFTHD